MHNVPRNSYPEHKNMLYKHENMLYKHENMLYKHENTLYKHDYTPYFHENTLYFWWSVRRMVCICRGSGGQDSHPQPEALPKTPCCSATGWHC